MRLRVGLHSSMQDTAVMVSRRGFTASLVVAGAVALTVSLPRDAEACGACYAASSESTVVNDHQMALTISKQRTVLWDQIQYTGNPKDFAYVLPAKPGTKLEPSNDAWFASLDASTRPIIMGPQPQYGGYGGDDEGIRCGGCADSDDMATSAAGGSSSSGGPGSVQIVEEAVVGPYETVTVRSTDPDALQKWLVAHGYAIPDISGPIIASYVALGFDFIAMRLQPSQSERKIEPIRIVAPGADLSLPLRLMQIGAGPKIGITLYVIGEGRYRTKSFPEGPVDFKELIWDYSQNRSNYQELLTRAMATSDGRAFVTEYANKPGLNPYAPLLQPGFSMGNPPLAAAYKQSCPTFGQTPPAPEEEEDAGTSTEVDAGDESDAGDPDASVDPDAGLDEDASPPRTSTDAGTRPPKKVRPTVCDDLDVALDGLSRDSVWVTRLRANLPNAALADTLLLEANPEQAPLDNVHQTTATGTITASVAPRRRSHHGTYALIGVTAFIVARIVRRRR